MRALTSLFQKTLTGQILYFPPHLYYSQIRSMQIERTPPVPTEREWSQGVLEAHFLTGSRQVADFLFAAKSLVRNYPDRILIQVHGDASLTQSHATRIERHFPNSFITSQETRDRILEPELRKRKHARCAAFRKLNVFAGKLIDIALIAKGDRYLYIDTDCLSFRRLDCFRTFARDERPRNLIARDCAYGYCLKPWEIERHFQIGSIPNVNAGLYLATRGSIDLERVERWLSVPGFDMRSHFAEQTLLAALLLRAGADILDERQFDVGRRFGEKTASLVHYCGHYLSGTRVAMRRVGQRAVAKALAGSAPPFGDMCLLNGGG